ncbi:MAG: FtsQ-type POTRA domain-containing protein [Endomicrobium sp.]|nr:FtsQ-type POTRA domain-containing protein [Endomicrobium sp.]
MINFIRKFDKIIVKSIEITGAKNITKTEIKELLPFKIGDNLLKINLSEAECEIKKLKPELKNIVISRCWQKVKIKLCERIPEAFIMHENRVFATDFDGTLFPIRGFMGTMKVPILLYKSNSEMKELLDFIKRFKAVCDNFIENIHEIKINNAGDIIFIINNENIVVFWGNESPEYLCDKFKKFKKIYKDALSKYEHLEYIDMTLYSSGRAAVKPIKYD